MNGNTETDLVAWRGIYGSSQADNTSIPAIPHPSDRTDTMLSIRSSVKTTRLALSSLCRYRSKPVTIRRRAVFRIPITIALAAMSAFSLSACADPSGNDGVPETEQSVRTTAKAGASVPKGVVTTSAGRYVFTATTCVAGMEDGAIDAEISGPGTGPDGEPIFVDFGSVGQEITIGLGVDKPFSSPEQHLRGGQYVTRPFSVTLTGRTVRVADIKLTTDDGSALDGEATFEVNCG